MISQVEQDTLDSTYKVIVICFITLPFNPLSTYSHATDHPTWYDDKTGYQRKPL